MVKMEIYIRYVFKASFILKIFVKIALSKIVKIVIILKFVIHVKSIIFYIKIQNHFIQ